MTAWIKRLATFVRELLTVTETRRADSVRAELPAGEVLVGQSRRDLERVEALGQLAPRIPVPRERSAPPRPPAEAPGSSLSPTTPAAPVEAPTDRPSGRLPN